MVAEVTPVVASSNRKSILAYPADWASDFGDNYYIHSHPDPTDANWNIHHEGTPYKESDIAPTPINNIPKGIHEILEEITQEANNE